MEELNVMEPSDGNKFYQCTVVIDGENPDNGKPKKYKEVHLVESCSPSGVEKKLAEQMVRIGKLANRETTYILTDMNQPLGYTIGNTLWKGYRYPL